MEDFVLLVLLVIDYEAFAPPPPFHSSLVEMKEI